MLKPEPAAAPTIAPQGFTPIECLAGALDAGVLFLCDHACNVLPAEYGDLGLPPAEFERHIAYDIGAATIVRHLAGAFGAPAVLTTYSRLLIDPNRGADDPTLVMRISDGALIPGNARIGSDEIERRRRLFWQPYRDATAQRIDAMVATGRIPAIIDIHTFTPVFKDMARPWHVAVLWDDDGRLAVPLIAALRREGDLVVGDNEPYDGALLGDTLNVHATVRGLANVLIEVRQDLVARERDAVAWAKRLERVLRPVLAQPDAHMIEYHRSRAGAVRPTTGKRT